MSEKLRSFTVSVSPFEEFELIVSWHTYQRLAEEVEQYNLLFDKVWEMSPVHHTSAKKVVLLDYLGANGFTKDHRFFALVLDNENKTYDIERITGSVNPGDLFNYCDKLQFDNKDQLIQSVVSSITLSIEEVFEKNTSILN